MGNPLQEGGGGGPPKRNHLVLIRHVEQGLFRSLQGSNGGKDGGPDIGTGVMPINGRGLYTGGDGGGDRGAPLARAREREPSTDEAVCGIPYCRECLGWVAQEKELA